MKLMSGVVGWNAGSFMQDFTTLTNQAQRGPAAFYKNGDYIEIKEQDKMNRINEQDKMNRTR